MFRPHFDVRLVFERDLGAVATFPPDVVTVAPTFTSQIEAIRALEPDWFVVFDSGWREPWIQAGSPGKLVLEIRTTSSALSFLTELRATQRIDLIIVATRYLATRLAEVGLSDLAPIAIVPNIYLPPSEDDDSFWSEPLWSAPRPTLLWIGRLEPHKGLARFTRILDSVADLEPLPILVGGTNDTEAEVLDAARGLFGPRRHPCVWLPRVRHEMIPRVYRSVAASGGGLIITSEDENFPNTAVEATMLGCPVIARAVGGLPELIPAEALFPPDDDERAASLVRRLLTDRAFGPAIARSTRAIVEPLTDPEAALPAYLSALDRALPTAAPSVAP
jgi:glycosyltransferase involved in cell wall biosynthesis